jgi:hypothetical protein
VLDSLPRESQVFYAPAIDHYVVTRYADIEAVLLNHETYSSALAQLPLVQLLPEAAQILLAGGHKPQPSMVSLDPPAHTRTKYHVPWAGSSLGPNSIKRTRGKDSRDYAWSCRIGAPTWHWTEDAVNRFNQMQTSPPLNARS